MGLAAGPGLGSRVPALQVVTSTMSKLLEEDGEPGGWSHDDTLELLGLSPAKQQSPPLARTHGGGDLEPTVMEETSLASLAAKQRSGRSSAAGSSEEGDQAVEDESMVMRDRSLEDIVLENRSQTKLKSVSSSGTGSSTEIDQLIGNQEPVVMEETSLASLVAARSQTKTKSVSSSAKGSSTEIDQVAGDQEPIVMEERSLAAARSQTKLKSASGSAEGSSTEIDQLISDIKDPELDSSLEDIAAMINSQDSNATEDKRSPTPVFTTAATMIDQVCRTLLYLICLCSL